MTKRQFLKVMADVNIPPNATLPKASRTYIIAKPGEKGEARLAALTISKGAAAVGPMYDADPPHLDWRQDESPRARAMRSALVDVLVGSQERQR